MSENAEIGINDICCMSWHEAIKIISSWSQGFVPNPLTPTAEGE